MSDSTMNGSIINAGGANKRSLAAGPVNSDQPTTRLHDYLGRKLDDASYLLGFARSIIEGLTGGLPASDATLTQFRREYDAHFDPKHTRPSSRT